jgi:hypothetical protein
MQTTMKMKCFISKEWLNVKKTIELSLFYYLIQWKDSF